MTSRILRIGMWGLGTLSPRTRWSEKRCEHGLPHASSSDSPLTRVYENAETGVRIRPFQLYGMVRNPHYVEVLGTSTTRSALAVLERYGDPRSLRRLGRARLTSFVQRSSGGQWKAEHAVALITAATEAIALWQGGGLDFTELAWDLASEVRMIRQLDAEIDRLDERIAELYGDADPKGIVRSAPGVGPVLAGGILGRLGDANRFANLASVRSFSGMIPGVNQSGHSQGHPGITKQGDPGLRRDIWLAAELARHQDPQLAAKYHRLIVERQLHHYSAVCHLATTLLTRIASCWRTGQPYVVRDVDGRPVSRVEARAIVARMSRVPWNFGGGPVMFRRRPPCCSRSA